MTAFNEVPLPFALLWRMRGECVFEAEFAGRSELVNIAENNLEPRVRESLEEH